MIPVAYEDQVPTKAPADPTGPHKRIAHWVRALVTASGLTQEVFADKARLSRAAITNYLAGKRRIRSDAMEKLRRVAPAELRDFDTWDGQLPNGGGTKVASDLDRAGGGRVEAEPEGYATVTDDAAYIARKLDGIEDETERGRAVRGCLAAIEEARNPPQPGASKKADTRPAK